MFQYAFAFATSKKLKTNFFVEEDGFHSNCLNEFFKLKGNKNTLLSKLYRNYFNSMRYDLNIINVNHENSYSTNERLIQENNCVYNGFFQSEFYFKEYSDSIKQEFLIKNKHLVNWKHSLNINNKKPLIVLHVRRTDYLNYGDATLGGENLTLPAKYYDLCLTKISNLGDYNIVFVTDDPFYVKMNFNHHNPIISSNASSIIDFQILMNADIVVMANSSFSWWAAYLNKNAKRIFAPKFWLGFKIKKEYPANIIPCNWETIEF
jgi:hypothetical protein